MYQLKLSLPHLPKSTNDKLRSHWRDNHAENQSWDQIIHFATLGKRPAVPLTRARLILHRHYFRGLDFDGVVGSLKPVVDALVSVGILKDDSWPVVGAWFVKQSFRPKSKGPLLEISVEEIPGPDRL